MRLLRSRSPLETAAFWVVLILSYLALSGLAGTRGIGYSERVDGATNSVTFELNPFLWFPDAFLHADPAANPIPFILWWVVVSILIAEIVMVLYRLRFRPRARTRLAPPSKPPAPAKDSTPR